MAENGNVVTIIGDPSDTKLMFAAKLINSGFLLKNHNGKLIKNIDEYSNSDKTFYENNCTNKNYDNNMISKLVEGSDSVVCFDYIKRNVNIMNYDYFKAVYDISKRYDVKRFIYITIIKNRTNSQDDYITETSITAKAMHHFLKYVKMNTSNNFIAITIEPKYMSNNYIHNHLKLIVNVIYNKFSKNLSVSVIKPFKKFNKKLITDKIDIGSNWSTAFILNDKTVLDEVNILLCLELLN